MHADSTVAATAGWVRWVRGLFVLLLAWLAWGAFHDDYGSVPLVSGIDLAIQAAVRGSWNVERGLQQPSEET